MDGSDDFGDFDDEELIEAATQAEVPDDSSQKTPKPPKHKIHVPANAVAVQDVYYTQAPPSASMPWQVRGPIWQKAPVPSKTGVGRSPLNVRRKSLNDEIVSDEEEAFDPPKLPPASKNPTKARQYAVQDDVVSDEEDAFDPPMLPPKPARQQSALKPKGMQPVYGISQANIAALDATEELADLPSDAFSSSAASPEKQADEAIPITTQVRRQTLVAPQNGLRQTTLFGRDTAQGIPASQVNKRHNWPLANKAEPPTHHKLNDAATRTWVYPTNLGTIRDYQFNIVARGLYHNLLVALPTGLGKTFIAATIMLNWFRWTKESQIVFMAPTKPLVSQQVGACFGIAGIPRSETTMLTGGIPTGLRAEEWLSKRVFFMTPQTLLNDLKTGICDPKRIVLLVVDEAHRATGAYSYVEVVKFIRRFNESFRVLALTATPGSDVESVQKVIDGLDISRVEIRTEHSIDIRQYVHFRQTETSVFDPSEEMTMLMDLYSKAVEPLLGQLSRMNATWSRDPLSLTPYGLTIARQQWMNSDAGRNANWGIKGMVISIFSLLASLAHCMELLKNHGISPFYHSLLNFRRTLDMNEKGKPSKWKRQISEDPNFEKMMGTLRSWTHNPDFIGHPKLEFLRSALLNHLMDAGEGRGADRGPPSSTRIMVFAHYRDSAEDIVRVLKRNEPIIRPHVFVGQAGTKSSEAMNQKKQLEVVQKFKDGIYNTLVATSIGEEGLDIGEVDLIVCYDSKASPIRMLQRMGRTGRKRAGKIILLQMRGKEENDAMKAKDSYEKMQALIASGTQFTFHDDLSRRILPKEIQPVVDKRIVDIPLENSQPDLPEPTARGRKAPKRPPKKFHMPDGVRTGFVAASRLNGSDENEEDELAAVQPKKRQKRASAVKEPPEEIVPNPFLSDVILNKVQERELERKYQSVFDGDEMQTVAAPRLDAHPARQRKRGRTKYISHGRRAVETVDMLNRMHRVNNAYLNTLKQNLHMSDIENELPGVVVDDDEEEEEVAPYANATPLRKPTRRPKATSHYRDVDCAAEGQSSSPPPTDPRYAIRSQAITLGSEDTSGDDDEEMLDPESELADFIADDAEPIPLHTSQSFLDDDMPESSLPAVSLQPTARISHVFQEEEDSDEEDEKDLPTLSTLVGGKRTQLKPPEPVPPPAVKRGRKRRVIEEEDDEDE
ncbi:3'-5' DNA helicase [Coniosporium tulheliwenetii]|uniref:3'-5' DNA helicase n=1 Tax=Coniosporium tulheliwenetii TaxID=3383036 RepID=A0ACC2ZLA7_9PEZI|nr:3'-5' DNA helicase [Cladosporium sp. JES 115]